MFRSDTGWVGDKVQRYSILKSRGSTSAIAAIHIFRHPRQTHPLLIYLMLSLLSLVPGTYHTWVTALRANFVSNCRLNRSETAVPYPDKLVWLRGCLYFATRQPHQLPFSLRKAYASFRRFSVFYVVIASHSRIYFPCRPGRVLDPR